MNAWTPATILALCTVMTALAFGVSHFTLGLMLFSKPPYTADKATGTAIAWVFIVIATVVTIGMAWYMVYQPWPPTRWADLVIIIPASWILCSAITEPPRDPVPYLTKTCFLILSVLNVYVFIATLIELAHTPHPL